MRIELPESSCNFQPNGVECPVVTFYSLCVMQLSSFFAANFRCAAVFGFVSLLGACQVFPAPKSGKVTRVHITHGHVEPEPIAFPSLSSDSASREIAHGFLSVIQNDLCSCGVFRALSPSSFLQKSDDLALNEPRFSSWSVLKARFLVCGTAKSRGQATSLHLRVYDVNCCKKVLAFAVDVTRSNWRRAAHMAADQIYTRLTGEKGMFDTRIAYVEAVPPVVSRGRKVTYLRRLKVMDQDGANAVALTGDDHLIMSPQFSPDGRTLAYLYYRTEGTGRNRHPVAHVYLMDVATKHQRPLLTPAHFEAISRANGNRPVNMTYAPRFSPDGRSVCFSLIIDGKSAIYTMNISTGNIRRLTDHRAIDTSPAYSPDGRSIVFTSNRSGREKVYIMNVDGTNVRRVTNGEGKYSQPVYSPRGDFIACTKQIGNQFFIVVVRPNGTEERSIISGYLVENPCWSPNGRYILFVWQDAPRHKQCLAKVDLTGFFMQRLNTKSDVRDCAWSPLLG